MQSFCKMQSGVASEHICQRPIKIGIFGAKGVGKSSTALQYLTEHHTDPGPTTIEDIYRKDVTISISDRETVKAFYVKWRNGSNQPTEKRKASESDRRRSRRERKSSSLVPDSTKLKFSFEITDTCGYCPLPVEKPPRPSFLEKFTRRRQNNQLSPREKAYRQKKPRSRSSSSLGSVSLVARHDSCLSDSDGLVLVFSLLDLDSLRTIRDIRNRFVRLKEDNGGARARKRSTLFPCCRGKPASGTGKIPPVFVVGTHSDLRNARMVNENTSRLYDVNFSRDRTMMNARRREKMKQSPGGKPPNSELVFPHHVYDVINSWPECAGFAEVSCDDRALVRQVFEDLALACVTSLPLSVWNGS